MARLDLPPQKKALANAEDLAISETRHCTAPERLESEFRVKFRVQGSGFRV